MKKIAFAFSLAFAQLAYPVSAASIGWTFTTDYVVDFEGKPSSFPIGASFSIDESLAGRSLRSTSFSVCTKEEDDTTYCEGLGLTFLKFLTNPEDVPPPDGDIVGRYFGDAGLTAVFVLFNGDPDVIISDNFTYIAFTTGPNYEILSMDFAVDDQVPTMDVGLNDFVFTTNGGSEDAEGAFSGTGIWSVGGDFEYIPPHVVPLPATLTLMALALFPLVAGIRRNPKRSLRREFPFPDVP